MDAQDRPDFAHIAKRARRMKLKLDENKGYWSHGVTLFKGLVPSLIGAMPHSAINPITGKFMTIRDCLRIMGMPDDFNLVGDSPLTKVNHICQNVPVGTAADMMTGIIAYLNGECEFSSSSYIKQSNKKREYKSQLPDSTSLESFLYLQK
jgi:hypothetical protein